MLIEYIKYAYNNAFRYPKRFWTMIGGVALSTFCILSLLAVITSIQSYNNHISTSLQNQNMNNKQWCIAPKSADTPVTISDLTEYQSLDGIEKAYYSEELSYYLYQSAAYIPWIEWNGLMNLSLNPILLDVGSAREYGLEDKLIEGSFFSGSPDEIILSKQVLQRFIKSDEVIQDKAIILDGETQVSASDGRGIVLKPSEIVGKTIELVYDMRFDFDRPKDSSLVYIESTKSIPLKVVGIYDPTVGYETKGDAWLSLALKQRLHGLDLTAESSQLSGQITLRVSNPTETQPVIDQAKKMNVDAKRTLEEDASIASALKLKKVENILYTFAFYTALIVSIISLIMICSLKIAERQYDITLQRSLGASKREISTFFSFEMLFVSSIGVMFGLLFTLLFLTSNVNELIGIYFYLDGSMTMKTMIIIPIVTLVISYVQIQLILRRQIILGLAKGGL